MVEKKQWQQDIVRRCEKNPIITLDDIPQAANAVFNAAATRCQDKYLLLLRVEGLEGKSRFFLAESADGIKFKISQEPVMERSNKEPFRTYEKRGVEDPRITKIEDTYYILYTAYSHSGTRIALASTQDFKTFRRIALISEPENKNAVLFPRKVNDHFIRFDRPALPAIALTTDTSILTAIGNDSSFDFVFSRQVEALAVKGDILVGISTSGSSTNVLKALDIARAKGVTTVSFTGEKGRETIGTKCDYCLVIPSTDTARIQECHEFVWHVICGLVEQTLFSKQ